MLFKFKKEFFRDEKNLRPVLINKKIKCKIMKTQNISFVNIVN